MFALGTNLLMGRAMMTRWDDRELPEWPPHPDRVFMALVAAWGESGEDENGKSALRWLETLGPPALNVKLESSIRTPFISYVPVNDDASPLGKKGKSETPMGSMPIGRSRQPRAFPVTVPAEPIFHLIWPEAELPPEHREALETTCSQVTYLGHSATPVQMWVETQQVEANLLPTEGRATHRLRTFGPGRVDYLKSRFDAGLRPQPALWAGYATKGSQEEREVCEGPFDPALLVFRAGPGRKLSLEACGAIAEMVRQTLMRRQGQDIPEWLSGHAADGARSKILRPAYLPLGFVGHEHADGHLLGMAIAVPADFSSDCFNLLVSLLTKHGEPEDVVANGSGFLRLRLRAGELPLELDERPFGQRPMTLQPQKWTGSADCWATATPLLLPRFPRRELTPEDIVARACIDAGYPEPVSVRAQYAPFLRGVPHAKSFPTPPSKPGIPPRLRMHAQITFANRVRGPVLVGSGRFAGYGVCHSMIQEQQT